MKKRCSVKVKGSAIPMRGLLTTSMELKKRRVRRKYPMAHTGEASPTKKRRASEGPVLSRSRLSRSFMKPPAFQESSDTALTKGFSSKRPRSLLHYFPRLGQVPPQSVKRGKKGERPWSQPPFPALSDPPSRSQGSLFPPLLETLTSCGIFEDQRPNRRKPWRG